MTSVSAYFERAISASWRTNIAAYLVLVVVALMLSGCGSNDTNTTPTTPQAGATATADAAPQAPATGTTGDASGADGTAREQAAFTVQIGLKNGKFTTSTPKAVAIIESVPLELEFDVRDDEEYSLVVATGTGEITEQFVFDRRGSYKKQFPALKRDEVFRLSLRDETIEITAGFEPGP